MPGGDRTGPMGAGPRTGRAAGYCSGFSAPGFANPVMGRGYGLGFGRGFGFGGGRRGRWRGWFRGWRGWGVPYPAGYGMDAAQPDVEALRQEARYLEGALEDIRKRISDLEEGKAAGQ